MNLEVTTRIDNQIVLRKDGDTILVLPVVEMAKLAAELAKAAEDIYKKEREHFPRYETLTYGGMSYKAVSLAANDKPNAPRLYVSVNAFNQIRSYIQSGQPVDAIRMLRGAALFTEELGLKHAKDIVEYLRNSPWALSAI